MALPPLQVNGLDDVAHTTTSGNAIASSSTTVASTTTQVLETSIANGVTEQVASITEYSSSAMEVDDPSEARHTRQATTSRVTVGNIVQRASSLPLSLAPKYRFGYVYDDAMLLHSPQTEHPEMPERLIHIFNKLQQGAIFRYMKRIPIRDAKKFEVLLVHSEDHWDKVEAIKRKLCLSSKSTETKLAIK